MPDQSFCSNCGNALNFKSIEVSIKPLKTNNIHCKKKKAKKSSAEWEKSVSSSSLTLPSAFLKALENRMTSDSFNLNDIRNEIRADMIESSIAEMKVKLDESMVTVVKSDLIARHDDPTGSFPSHPTGNSKSSVFDLIREKFNPSGYLDEIAPVTDQYAVYMERLDYLKGLRSAAVEKLLNPVYRNDANDRSVASGAYTVTMMSHGRARIGDESEEQNFATSRDDNFGDSFSHHRQQQIEHNPLMSITEDASSGDGESSAPNKGESSDNFQSYAGGTVATTAVSAAVPDAWLWGQLSTNADDFGTNIDQFKTSSHNNAYDIRESINHVQSSVVFVNIQTEANALQIEESLKSDKPESYFWGDTVSKLVESNSPGAELDNYSSIQDTVMDTFKIAGDSDAAETIQQELSYDEFIDSQFGVENAVHDHPPVHDSSEEGHASTKQFPASVSFRVGAESILRSTVVAGSANKAIIETTQAPSSGIAAVRRCFLSSIHIMKTALSSVDIDFTTDLFEGKPDFLAQCRDVIAQTTKVLEMAISVNDFVAEEQRSFEESCAARRTAAALAVSEAILAATQIEKTYKDKYTVAKAAFLRQKASDTSFVSATETHITSNREMDLIKIHAETEMLIQSQIIKTLQAKEVKIILNLK
jgi:hypothetical protein